jgi:hypothetical protein
MRVVYERDGEVVGLEAFSVRSEGKSVVLFVKPSGEVTLPLPSEETAKRFAASLGISGAEDHRDWMQGGTV